MLTAAKLIIDAALSRKESIGAHTIIDSSDSEIMNKELEHAK